MKGLITGRDVLVHAFTIVRLFGARAWLRCLRAALGRRPTTFLAALDLCHARAARDGGS